MRLVGTKLKELRTSRGITQSDLASVLHTDPSNVSHIEAGRQELRVSQLVKISKVLGVRVCDLVAPLDARSAA
jgi:transcriptional regulator with XRE-family HTH domain